MTGLFRKEAVEYRRQRLMGEVIIAQPPSFAIMTALLSLIVATGLAALIFGSYARTETARGFLAPEQGAVKVYAPVPGLVTDRLVREGETVAAGAPLMTIITEQATTEGESAEAQSLTLIAGQLAMLRNRREVETGRAAAERRRLENDLKSLDAEIAEVQAQREVQTKITASAKAAFENLSELVERGYVTKSEYEQRRQNYLTQQQLGRQLDQKSIVLKREREASRTALDQLPRDLSKTLGDIDNDIAELKQRRAQTESRQAYTLKAPVAGRVAALQAQDGRMTNPATPLLILLPENGELEAEIFVPSRAVGFVAQGQEVRMLYDAFPYQRFGSYPARVKNVTRTILAPEEVTAPFKLDEPVYRVTLAIEKQKVPAFGGDVPLQPGMTLRANIVLERQSLLAWLMEPLRAVRNRS